MIQSQFLSPLCSALIHGGVMVAVAWTHMGGDAPLSLRVPTYQVVFEETMPPEEPASQPAKSERIVSKLRKASTPIKKSRRTTGSSRSKGDPGQLEETSYPPIPASGLAREAQYSGGSLHNKLPSYPLIARKNAHEGHVELRVHVSERGDVMKTIVSQSSKHWELDQAAMDAVKEWRFLPAINKDGPISSETSLSFDFRLTGILVG